MRKELTFILIVFSLNTIAQISGKKIMNIPEKFASTDEPVVMDLNYYPVEHDGRTYEQNWIVYSDRDNNPTFQNPTGSGVFKKAEFLQQFFVVEENGDYVHIVKDDTNPIDINLAPTAEDYGWIHKNKLIIYRACLKNQEKINQKGMLVNSKETIERAKEGDESTLVKFYTHPDLRTPTNDNSKLYQIYHIYKKVGNSVLLGKAYETRGKMEDNMVGWVPFDRVTNWKHRIAIEPNWEENAWRERKSENTLASIFLEKNNCDNFIKGAGNSKPVWSSDPVKDISGSGLYERPIGEWRRFPVLDYIDNNRLRIGVVGDIHTQTSIYSSKEGASVDEKISDFSSNLEKKNFMFVIDGTTSMQPYFKAVSNAVRISIQKLNERYGADANPPKFGCVVYRDFAERNRLTESFDLSPDASEIIRFIENVEAKDYKDTDAVEAVNYGLAYGLRLLPQYESNFIILIGDAGNHNRKDASYVPDQQISKMIQQKQCHFLSFQVANQGGPDYEQFAENIKRILEESANSIRSSNLLASSDVMVGFSNSNNSPDYIFNKLKNSPIAGNVIKCKAGKTVSPDLLQNEIVTLVESSEGLVSDLKKDVTEIQSGTSYKLVLNRNSSMDEYSRYVDSYNEILLNVLNNMGLNREQADFISQNRFQYYSPAFAPLKKNGLDNNLFKPVVLMSRIELHKLHMMFDMLGDIIELPMNERRQRYYDTWMELLSSHLGESDTERLRELASEELSDIIYGTGGLNIVSNMLKTSINCTMDPSCMSDRDFNAFLSILKSKAMRLEAILNDNNDPRQFRSAGIIYYWLDFDVLP